MKIALDIVPNEIIRQYNIHAQASNGWVYMEIRKVMPGLKQAGRIVNERHQRKEIAHVKVVCKV